MLPSISRSPIAVSFFFIFIKPIADIILRYIAKPIPSLILFASPSNSTMICLLNIPFSGYSLCIIVCAIFIWERVYSSFSLPRITISLSWLLSRTTVFNIPMALEASFSEGM